MTEKIYIEVKGKIIGYDAKVSEDTRIIKGLSYHLVEHISTGFKYLISEQELNDLRKVSMEISQLMSEIDSKDNNQQNTKQEDSSEGDKVEKTAIDTGVIGVMKAHLESRLALINKMQGTGRPEQLNAVIAMMSELKELCGQVIPAMKKEFEKQKNIKN
tara:strand:- start:143 stop:619 length:477 start_codon:yes stop_codon:yes gene_type:complete